MANTAGSRQTAGNADVQPGTIAHAVLEQAAQWFALLRSGEASSQQREEWQRWLAQHGSHRDAWQFVQMVSQRFELLQDDTLRQPAVAALRATRQRRRMLASLGVLAGAGLLGWTAWRETPLGDMALAWQAEHRTATGEIRRIVLADGTEMWLNTASAVDTDFGGALRRVQLARGEILIQTGHGDARPFVVDTPHGRLRALGTRFTVRLDGDATYLGVYEGAVEAHSAGGPLRVVEAGQQTLLRSGAIDPVAAVQAARQAWSRGVLLAEDITLAELVRELNRYRSGHLAVAPDVAQLRVLGGYPLRDPAKALAMLESALPVRVRSTLPWWTTIEARTDAGAPAK